MASLGLLISGLFFPLLEFKSFPSRDLSCPMAVARPLASLLVGGALVAAIIAQLLMGLTARPIAEARGRGPAAFTQTRDPHIDPKQVVTPPPNKGPP